MGLAAAEACLGLDDGLATVAGQSPQRVDKQRADARRDVGVAEEADRVAVLGRVGASVVDLLEVGGELGLAKDALRHVLIYAHHLPPRRQGSGGAGLTLGRLVPRRGVRWWRHRAGQRRRRGGGGEQRVPYALDLCPFVWPADLAEHVDDVEQVRPGELGVDVLRGRVGRLVSGLLYLPQGVLHGHVVAKGVPEGVSPVVPDKDGEVVYVQQGLDVDMPTGGVRAIVVRRPSLERVANAVVRPPARYAPQVANDERAHGVSQNVQGPGESVLVGSAYGRHCGVSMRYT